MNNLFSFLENECTNLEETDNYILKREIKYGNAVYLNIYHLSLINYILQIFGIGIYHTTIEVDNIEYSFGLTKTSIPGYYICKAGTLKKDMNLKECIYLGHTLYSKNTIFKLLSLKSIYWNGLTYEPFLKNCNTFTEFFAKELLNDHFEFPLYINRLTSWASLFSSFYPPIKNLYHAIITKINIKVDNSFEYGQSLQYINDDTSHCSVLINDNKTINYCNNDETENFNIKPNNCKEYDKMFYDILKTNPYLYIKIFDNISLPYNMSKQCIDFIKQYKRIESNEERLIIDVKDVLDQIKFNDNIIKEVNSMSRIVLNNNDNIFLNTKLDLNKIIKIKLYHIMYMIYYEKKKYSQMKNIPSKILTIDLSDKYTSLELAYINFKYNKLNECLSSLQEFIKFSRLENENKIKVLLFELIGAINNLIEK